MISVSVVEDRHEIAQSLANAIQKTDGLRFISSYTNGEDALRNLPTDIPNVVLMDIGLPRMDGIECMIRIRMKTPHIEFLMFTVFDKDEKVFDALQAGASGYVLKSDGVRGAIRALHDFAAGGAPMSHDIARKVLASFQKKERHDKSDFEMLTRQQKTILELMSKGLLNKEIADQLHISEGTVKQHNYTIYKKLQVNNRIEAVNKYLHRNT